MILNFMRIIKIFLLFMFIDGIWLVSMNQRFYRPYLGYLFRDSVQYGWAILFYVLYAVAVHHFIIMPSLHQQEISLLYILLQGFLLGLVVYSAYDLTNQATVKNWPLIVTIVDMLWGATLTALVSVLSYKFN